MVMNLTSHSRVELFPKTFFGLSRCRITEHKGSEDLLSQSLVHANHQDEVVFVSQQAKEAKT
jgi:hypothetical protein